MPLDRTLFTLAAAQHGLLTFADLAAAEVTRAQRRTLLGSGTLERIGQRTLRMGGSPATERQRAMAAALDTGGWLSHRSSAWLLLDAGRFPLGEPPEVTVRGGRVSYRGDLAVVHTTTNLPADDILVVDGIPTVSAARTVLGLAAVVGEIGEATLRAAVDDAVRRGIASDRWLWWRLEQLRCRGRDGVAAMEAVLSHRAGDRATEGWLEATFIEILEEFEVPLPICQRRIARSGAFVARVDFAYVDAPLVIEVLGFTHHSSEQQLAADAARRNALQVEGRVVLEFVYDDLVRRPASVAASVHEARRALLDRRHAS
jgi:hypothetical protein